MYKFKKISILILLVLTLILGSNAIASSVKPSYVLAKNQLNGDLYWQRGDINTAISVWKQEALKYNTQKKNKLEIETLLKIAQGYISIGKFYLAIAELEKATALSPSDSYSKALTRRRLGNAYSGIGKFEQAIFNYQSSLQEEKSLPTLNSLVEVLLSKEQYDLFIAEEARKTTSDNSDTIQYATTSTKRVPKKSVADRNRAFEYAKLALSMSNATNLSSVRALINWNNLFKQNLSWQQIHKGNSILLNLPPSRQLAFTMLNWSDVDLKNKMSWLKRASNIAKSLNDGYLQSYVFLELGYYHKKLEDMALALTYAQKSQLIAQPELAYDSLFRAQQLAGQIHQEKGDSQAAITAYTNSIASLDLLRRDSLAISIEQRKNFSTETEPIYREVLKLVLSHPRLKKADLAKAIAISDRLRIAQLQNYFGDDCFEIAQKKSENLSSIKESTALINSIILENQIFFILRLPNGEIDYSQAQIGKSMISSKVEQWSKELSNGGDWNFVDNSRFFYDLIIKSFEPQLEKSKISQIEFVHDGILRNIPMAALFDGKQFLAQKWSSVSSLGLDFTPPESLVQNKDKLKAILFGLQNPVPGWTILSSVKQEINSIQTILGGDKLLDEQFTFNNLDTYLSQEDYSLVHLATHGYFGGAVETSFILAHDRRISALNLEKILNQSKQIPDLLVLSACETAAGSDKSLLGLAGIAARAGVKSTIGSLWAVDDAEQSEIIADFYAYWHDSTDNEAEALQKMQQAQIAVFAHPRKWAALSLVIN